jgi:hypothetical protein
MSCGTKSSVSENVKQPCRTISASAENVKQPFGKVATRVANMPKDSAKEKHLIGYDAT